ncbi:MAG: Uma2 family endonuclease [Chloroflexaceae bacterium]|nr:Uma2 family endonuclease [Chloroflexaceae bacterium]
MITQHAPIQSIDTRAEATVIPAPGRPWTADDLLALDDDHQYELLEGVLYQMIPASFQHGRYEMRLLLAIGTYLQENPIGEVFPGDTGFELTADPLTIRAPDVAFVSAERLQSRDMLAFLPLAPDLVVEIISPSETAQSIAAKVSDYLLAGTRLLWVVYPKRQQVHAYSGEHTGFRIYGLADMLDGESVLPGFQYALQELFG